MTSQKGIGELCLNLRGLVEREVVTVSFQYGSGRIMLCYEYSRKVRSEFRDFSGRH